MISAINLYLNQIIYCFNWAGLAAASGVDSYQLSWLPSESFFRKSHNFFVLQTNSTAKEFLGMLFLIPFPNTVFLPFCLLSSNITNGAWGPLNVVPEK